MRSIIFCLLLVLVFAASATYTPVSLLIQADEDQENCAFSLVTPHRRTEFCLPPHPFSVRLRGFGSEYPEIPLDVRVHFSNENAVVSYTILDDSPVSSNVVVDEIRQLLQVDNLDFVHMSSLARVEQSFQGEILLKNVNELEKKFLQIWKNSWDTFFHGSSFHDYKISLQDIILRTSSKIVAFHMTSKIHCVAPVKLRSRHPQVWILRPNGELNGESEVCRRILTPKFSRSFLKDGFHRDLQMKVEFSDEDASYLRSVCSNGNIVIRQFFSEAFFVDEYQLNEITRLEGSFRTILSGSVDVEKPSIISPSFVAEIVVPLSGPSLNITAPVHLRYQAPSSEITYRSAYLGPPSLLLQCNIVEKSPSDRCGDVRRTFGPVFEDKNSENFIIDFQQITHAVDIVPVPVGQLGDSSIVSAVTTIVSAIGALFLTWIVLRRGRQMMFGTVKPDGGAGLTRVQSN